MIWIQDGGDDDKDKTAPADNSPGDPFSDIDPELAQSIGESSTHEPHTGDTD